MIIKGLFGIYERWNPVHPTFGAFWGMGVGIGCGIGWGPGFGPEVIGYVGAGCGVGFSVGITLAGFGIGLPANYLFEVPYNVFVTTRRGASKIARCSGFLSGKDGSRECWMNVGTHLSVFQRETSRRLFSFKKNIFLDKGINLFDIQSKLSVHARSFPRDLGTFSSHFLHSRKGPKD